MSCRVAAGSTGRRAVIQGRDRVLAGQAVVLQTVMTASAVRVAVSWPAPGIKNNPTGEIAYSSVASSSAWPRPARSVMSRNGPGSSR